MTASEVPRWTAGPMLAIAWPGGIALVSATVGLPAAERIWSRLRRESQLGIFLKSLAEGSDAGFLDLPPFAIAVSDGDRWQVAVRGPVVVELQLGDRIETMTGEGITTWAERVLAAPEGVRLGAVSDEGFGGPIADGVVPAGSIVVGELRREAEARAASPGAPMRVAAEQAPEADSAVVVVAGDHQDAGPAVASSEPDAAEPPVDVAEPSPAPSDDPSPEGAEPSPIEAQETLAEEVPSPVPPPSKYASLWDHSIALDVGAAAIRPEGEEPPPVGDAASGALGQEQQDGDTVVDEGLVAIQMAMPRGGVPEVLARFCDRGHANPPERASCFVCGAEVAGEARRAPRPQLGWLRIEGGETIPLRGPVIAGRNPQATALKLTETPRLVALPQPHISSTHVAILIEGWRIMARDLRSRNGTYLRRHGKPPIRLPDTAIPLVAGDLIDLGKGLYIHLDRTP